MIRILGPDTSIREVVRELRVERTGVRVVPAGDSREAAYASFADALGFPEWCGHNLDAFYDCLGTWVHEHPGVALVWDGTATLKRAEPDYYPRMVQVLLDLAEERPFDGVVVERE